MGVEGTTTAITEEEKNEKELIPPTVSFVYSVFFLGLSRRVNKAFFLPVLALLAFIAFRAFVSSRTDCNGPSRRRGTRICAVRYPLAPFYLSGRWI